MIKTLLEFALGIFFGIFFRLHKDVGLPPRFEEVLKLYEKKGFRGTFAKIRVWDAPLEDMEKLVAKKGVVVDLGCGDGLIANYLALSEPKRTVIGVELNSLRVKQAQKDLRNTTIFQGDILKANFPQADTILLVHVLHHLRSFGQQVQLINKCRSKLKRGGNLVIVEIKERPFFKFLLTWLIDVTVFPMLFENKLFDFQIFYRREKEWKKFLKDAGFLVETQVANKGKPFSHLILSCKKRYNTPNVY